MDDEHSQLGIDERIRGAFRADPAATRRIAARAVAGRGALDAEPGTPAAGIRFAAIAALVVVLGIVVWRLRPPPSAPPSPAPLTSVAITGRGSIVVVDGNDGRRWIVGQPTAPPPQGRYVIVVRQ